MCICKGCTIGMSDLSDIYVPKHADYRPEDSFIYTYIGNSQVPSSLVLYEGCSYT